MKPIFLIKSKQYGLLAYISQKCRTNEWFQAFRCIKCKIEIKVKRRIQIAKEIFTTMSQVLFWSVRLETRNRFVKHLVQNMFLSGAGIHTSRKRDATE